MHLGPIPPSMGCRSGCDSIRGWVEGNVQTRPAGSEKPAECRPRDVARRSGAIHADGMITCVADVFLSYSLADAATAARLATQLRRAGVSVFGDRSIEVAETMDSALSTAIAEARVFVLIHPGQVGSSSFVHRETQAALSRGTSEGLPVLPVMLPGREPVGDIGSYRYVRVSTPEDFAPVIAIVLDLLRETRLPKGRSVAAQRLSFLSSLLHTDLSQAPQAAAVVLDEIARTVGGGSRYVARQLDLLRDATSWAEIHLGPDHPSAVSLRFRLTDALLRAKRYDESSALSGKSVDASTAPTDRLEASLKLGYALLDDGRLEEAQLQYQESLQLARQTDSRSAEATSLVALGTLARMGGDLAQARLLYRRAVDLTAGMSQPSVRIGALIGLCEVTAGTGDPDARRRYAEEALWLSRTTGDDALARRAASLVGIEEGGR